MSSIAPTASVSSQPPITPAKDDAQAVRIAERQAAKAAERTTDKKEAKVERVADRNDAKTEKAADRAADLAATAVKAQAAKKAGTGAVLDIQA